MYVEGGKDLDAALEATRERLVRAKRKVYSFVNSGKYEKDIYTRRFTKMLESDFIVDCLSEDLKKILLDLTIADGNNLKVAPCSFIDYGLSRVSEKQCKLSFISRFENNKGIEMLLDSLDAIYERCDMQPEFHFMGYGPLQKLIEASISGKNYEDHVKVYY